MYALKTLRTGIEPVTFRLTVERSNQLSYQSFFYKKVYIFKRIMYYIFYPIHVLLLLAAKVQYCTTS